jgi:hypothetical protein
MSRQTNEDRAAWNKTLIVRRTVGIVAMTRLNWAVSALRAW